MRPIFDTDAKFFKHMISQQSDDTTAGSTDTTVKIVRDVYGPRVENMTEEDRTWRMSLKCGSELDVLKFDVKEKK